jgi:hypothetical protein
MNRKHYFAKTRNIRRRRRPASRASKRSHRFFTRRNHTSKKQRGGMYTGLGAALGLNPSKNSLIPYVSEEGSSVLRSIEDIEEEKQL